ncbi:hypothetical protein PROFUN_01878 [Planoprotostelium fungivorum]|uniref:Uncharacterized protein n=1 Tax=Planoprotostelium fungivorum TaxID=1890364 RepID=A0A2P6NZ08_9EUKA|nr:hypothetical protein PROFUN_01878 [Planoprotostelium fungivorum]
MHSTLTAAANARQRLTSLPALRFGSVLSKKGDLYFKILWKVYYEGSMENSFRLGSDGQLSCGKLPGFSHFQSCEESSLPLQMYEKLKNHLLKCGVMSHLAEKSSAEEVACKFESSQVQAIVQEDIQNDFKACA